MSWCENSEMEETKSSLVKLEVHKRSSWNEDGEEDEGSAHSYARGAC